MILHPTSVTANMTQPTTSGDSETLFTIGVTDFKHNGDGTSSDATEGADIALIEVVIKEGIVGTGRIRNYIYWQVLLLNYQMTCRYQLCQ